MIGLRRSIPPIGLSHILILALTEIEFHIFSFAGCAFSRVIYLRERIRIKKKKYVDKARVVLY